MREVTEETEMSVSLKEYFESKFAALDKANALAYQTLEKRLEGMNEFREALRDQTKNFITRVEHDVLCKEVQELKEFRSELKGKASQNSVTIAWILSGLGLAIGIAGLVAGIVK